MAFAAGLILSQFACGSKAPANLVTNTSSPTTTPNLAANTNTNAQPDVAVPTFDNAQAAFSAGEKYSDKDEVEKSIECYEQAVKLDPDLAEGYFKLGIAYALLEVDDTRIPGDSVPGEKPAKTGKGNVVEPANKSGKAFEQAVKAYKKLLAKNPADDLAQYNLGRAFSKLNKDVDSEKALRQAVKLKPEDAEYQRELGATLSKLAKYDEAIKALKKAESLEPDNSQIEGLLEKAMAGKKRVDFGKLKNDESQNGKDGKTDSNSNANALPRDRREPPRTMGNNEVQIRKP